MNLQSYHNNNGNNNNGNNNNNKIHQQEDDDIVDQAAEDFARQLHDRWGVGVDTKPNNNNNNNNKGGGGGTGVLVFLSVADRVVYISRGGALDPILTNRRIERIIASMRPSLKQAQYAEGLAHAIDQLIEYLQKGEEPSWMEWIWEDLFQIQNLFLLGWLSTLVGGIWKQRRQHEEQRIYAQAASQLSDLDRAQAQALQGQYQATSCPICLEEFDSPEVGSDQQPIKLLRCGHIFDETCWSEWVSSGQGTVTKCPICQKDVGPESTPTATTAATTAANQIMLPNNNDNDDHNDHDHNHNHNNDNHNHDQDRVVRRFQQERNFRLARLAYQYPRYISTNQLQRWTSPSYNGSLVRDPSFVQTNPQRHVPTTGRSGTTGMGSSGGRPSASFGGGSSSGGRGGRF
jgi:uncharacterized membrane protein YgcG